MHGKINLLFRKFAVTDQIFEQLLYKLYTLIITALPTIESIYIKKINNAHSSLAKWQHIFSDFVVQGVRCRGTMDHATGHHGPHRKCKTLLI